MRVRPLIPVALLLVASLPAAAGEDFTGFYAGVNAGYGFGRGAAEGFQGGPPVAGDRPNAGGDRPKAGSDLPPSAARAADRDGRTRAAR